MVTVSLGRVTRLARATADEVRRTVDSAVELGKLERIGRPHRNPDDFTVRFLDWPKWEVDDPNARRRQRLSRENRPSKGSQDDDWPDFP